MFSNTSHRPPPWLLTHGKVPTLSSNTGHKPAPSLVTIAGTHRVFYRVLPALEVSCERPRLRRVWGASASRLRPFNAREFPHERQNLKPVEQVFTPNFDTFLVSISSLEHSGFSPFEKQR